MQGMMLIELVAILIQMSFKPLKILKVIASIFEISQVLELLEKTPFSCKNMRRLFWFLISDIGYDKFVLRELKAIGEAASARISTDIVVERNDRREINLAKVNLSLN